MLEKTFQSSKPGQLRNELLLEQAVLLKRNGFYLESFETLLKVTSEPEAAIRRASQLCGLKNYRVVAQKMEEENFNVEDILSKAKIAIENFLAFPENAPPVSGKTKNSPSELAQDASEPQLCLIDQTPIANCRDFCSAIYHLRIGIQNRYCISFAQLFLGKISNRNLSI